VAGVAVSPSKGLWQRYLIGNLLLPVVGGQAAACSERVQLWLPFAYSQRGWAALFHIIKNTPIPVGIGGCCFWGPGVV